MHANTTQHGASSRRRFLVWALGGLSTLSAALVGVPVLGMLLAPAVQTRGKETWVDFGPVDAIPVGVPRLLTAMSRQRDAWHDQSVRRAVWVVRGEHTGLTVFSPHCTHLGCVYRWDQHRNQFACPCHGGTYAITGEVTGGPPPHGLLKLATKTEQGTLRVRFVSEGSAA
ncbi:MAG: ubiquinol-cytochrome c reductase iron-sulfur subunit [Candidatus Binatia bacterium]